MTLILLYMAGEKIRDEYRGYKAKKNGTAATSESEQQQIGSPSSDASTTTHTESSSPATSFEESPVLIPVNGVMEIDVAPPSYEEAVAAKPATSPIRNRNSADVHQIPQWSPNDVRVMAVQPATSPVRNRNSAYGHQIPWSPDDVRAPEEEEEQEGQIVEMEQPSPKLYEMEDSHPVFELDSLWMGRPL